LRERLAIDLLHRQAIDCIIRCVERVQVVNLADIEMADLTRGARFRRKTITMPRPSALQRDAAIQFRIDGFVYHAHAARSQQAHDPKPIAEDRAWNKS
jgi:hypothetical protein